MWLALAIGVGVSMFLLKYKVQDLENELIAKQEQVIRDQGAIRVLQAEWTYLNDPERLRQLSGEHLGFAPPALANMTEIASLPFRVPAPAHGNADGALPQRQIPARGEPADPALPQIHTQLRMPATVAASTPRSPSVVSVSIARLQRLLLPTAAGATSPSEGQR